VGDLIERLSTPIPTGGLRDAMADVLHDPDLRVALPLGKAWVDEAGATVPDPLRDGAMGSTRIVRDGRTLAVIGHDPAIDEGLIAAAGAATAMALENARLHAEVRARLEEVRASRARIVDAADAERRRIERDLHDGAQQRLLTLSFRLRAAMRRTDGVDAALAGDLAQADEELRGAIEELRDLARGIHPAILTDEGLGPALGSLADRAPMPVHITATPGRRLPPPIEAAAYFVVAEGLTNAARHAGTPVDVSAQVHGGRLVVRVSDDGPGGADGRSGSGLRGLADRVEAVDGSLTIDSHVGTGTCLTAEFPCA
jgi:signal transduction histidine kinase